jgi:hypothetical protein
MDFLVVHEQAIIGPSVLQVLCGWRQFVEAGPFHFSP